MITLETYPNFPNKTVKINNTLKEIFAFGAVLKKNVK